MKKSNKIKSILGALFLNSGVIKAAKYAYELPSGDGILYGPPRPEVIAKNVSKVVLIPIAFLIGLFVLIFGKKFNMKKKTRMIVFTILMLIAIIITTILFMI